MMRPAEGNLYEVEVGPVVWIDVPSQYASTCYHILPALNLPNLAAIGRPTPSYGSSKEMRRSVIKLHIGPGQAGDLETQIVVKWLMEQLASYEAVVGRQGLMADRAAMIVDVNSPQAGFLFQQLCTNMLILSPKQLLVTTIESASRWQRLIAIAWESNPLNAVVSIKHRSSCLLYTSDAADE